jgi:hypothetical protein
MCGKVGSARQHDFIDAIRAFINDEVSAGFGWCTNERRAA